jgi:hypothetical protein
MGDAEIGTVDFLVTQLQACGDKPPVTNPKFENWRRSILGQVRFVLMDNLQDHRVVSRHVGRAIPAELTRCHAAIHFCNKKRWDPRLS